MPASADSCRPPKCVLFVDDEVDLLDALRDALRRYRRVWRMRFVTGGAAALAALEAEPTDVIVSDIQMPGMDGAELLALVQKRYPATIRIVLSGSANAGIITRAATVAHRILAKPCDIDDLALIGSFRWLDSKSPGNEVFCAVPGGCGLATCRA